MLDNLPRKNRWVFSATRPKPFQFDHFWRQIRSEAGLNDVRLHDLRHSYASVALQNGETILTIGKLLGHGRATTTLRYTHLHDGAVREAIDVVRAGSVGGSGMRTTARKVRLTDAAVERPPSA